MTSSQINSQLLPNRALRIAPAARSGSAELGREVIDRCVERRQFLVVGLGYVDVEFVVQPDDDVEEIERVDVELVAQRPAQVGQTLFETRCRKSGCGRIRS